MKLQKLAERVSAAAQAEDEAAIDALCLEWLVAFCKDHGKEGETAKKLLHIVGGLLEIS